MKKKYIILVGIFVLIFVCFYYKKIFTGNNIIKPSEEKVIESILSDTLEYKAKVKVKIYSNKNENEYEITQEETKSHSYLEVTSDSDISGLIIDDKKDKLIVKNTKLNLEKIYQNYTAMMNNCLFLSSFSKEYKESEDKKQYEEEENFVIKITLSNPTKYIKYKELYIDKKTGLPKMLIVKNGDKQVKACIKYINIEIL